jgi:hypothetical protein
MGLFNNIFSRRRVDDIISTGSSAPSAAMDEGAAAASSSQRYVIPPLSPTAASIGGRCTRSVSHLSQSNFTDDYGDSCN